MSNGFIKCDEILINMKYIKSIKRGQTTEITVANTDRFTSGTVYIQHALDKVYKCQQIQHHKQIPNEYLN